MTVLLSVELVPAPISDLTSAPVIPDARDGVAPFDVIAAFEPALLIVILLPLLVISILVPSTKFIVSPAAVSYTHLRAHET